ncbi:MAG: gamma-glutamylcyclotransferase [Ruminococcaceae bacterium]|nr:gamma-glutamylcyclotransferase [Oscillospiraceae bacterium]
MARKKTTKLYVAYGSNLHLNQMHYRCPDAKVFGSGVIENHRLTFWGHNGRGGVATILPETGTNVPVGIWEISAADEKSLDIYEGWPHLYRKEDIEVVMDDGSVITGMVYIMNSRQGIIRDAWPSDGYYETIASGYRSFGFDLGFLKNARDTLSYSCKKLSLSDWRFGSLSGR